MRPLSMPSRQVIILAKENRKFRQEFSLKLTDPLFKSDLDALGKKLRPTNKHGLGVDADGWVVEFMEKYGFDHRWDYAIRTFLATGELDDLSYPHGPRITFNSKANTATVEVYPETTQKEYQGAWKVIMNLLKKGKAQRQSPTHNHKRDVLVLQLDEQGLSNKEIAQELNDQIGSKLGYADVATILRRAKRKRDN